MKYNPNPPDLDPFFGSFSFFSIISGKGSMISGGTALSKFKEGTLKSYLLETVSKIDLALKLKLKTYCSSVLIDYWTGIFQPIKS